ncbi:hypothetical protein D3C71_1385240 [compost metagenome]
MGIRQSADCFHGRTQHHHRSRGAGYFQSARIFRRARHRAQYRLCRLREYLAQGSALALGCGPRLRFDSRLRLCPSAARYAWGSLFAIAVLFQSRSRAGAAGRPGCSAAATAVGGEVQIV